MPYNPYNCYQIQYQSTDDDQIIEAFDTKREAFNRIAELVEEGDEGDCNDTSKIEMYHCKRIDFEVVQAKTEVKEAVGVPPDNK